MQGITFIFVVVIYLRFLVFSHLISIFYYYSFKNVPEFKICSKLCSKFTLSIGEIPNTLLMKKCSPSDKFYC